MEIPEEDLSRVYALTPRQQLTYWTGAIAQNDVWLEMTVFRLAGSAVLAPGMSRSDLPRHFERLRVAVKSIVKASRLPENLKTDAVAALGRAKIAHRARVELVHDQWGLVEASRPAEFIVMDALMGRGWPDTPLTPRTLPDFEAAARAHMASIHELSEIAFKMSTFYADEATARFVATQIAIHLVGGPIDNHYRATARETDGSPPDFDTEDGATYKRGFQTVELHQQADYNYLDLDSETHRSLPKSNPA